jgi:hypothetical protein
LDGKYHLKGQLQAAPKTAFNFLLKSAVPVIEAAGLAGVVIVAPIPRYVKAGCCGGGDHITNQGEDGFYDELRGAAANAAASVAAAGLSGKCNFIDCITLMGGADADIRGMVTAAGRPVWTEQDPVHMTADGYKELAAAITEMGGANDAGHGAAKRQRLESVIPGLASIGGRGLRGNIRPPQWVAGAADRGGGGRGTRSRGSYSGGGSGPARSRGLVRGRFSGARATRRAYWGRRSY